MVESREKERWRPTREKPQPRIIRWLLRAKVTTGFRSAHFWLITGLFAIYAYFYYGVATSMRDILIFLFFHPLVYTASVYRLRGVMVSGVVFLGIMAPHIIQTFNNTPELMRSLLFIAFAFLLAGPWATLLNYLENQVETRHEILSLNDKLQRYIDQLESTQRQLIQAEKLNAIGQLAASVAHEINNPLAGVLVYSKLLIKKLNSDSFDKTEAIANLQKIESAVDYCSRIMRGLLDFSRQSEPNLQPVAMSQVIDQVMLLVGHQAEMNKVQVIRDEAPSLPPVMADFGQLQQVLVNLVVNAVQAMPGGGKLTIHSSLDNNGWVQVAVEDTGHGIAPEHMDKLFTPFFTTKEPGKGVGLGLAVSYGIIERHGGKIEVKSEVGKGSTFTVRLPAYTPEDKPAQQN
jgi:signal transduction histidine kinase